MFLLRNFHAKRVTFEIAMMNIFNNCVAGSLNNNYFPLKFQPLITMFYLFNNCLKEYLSKNNSKTFNGLILLPYSYPKLTAPRFIILTKYTVVCNMPFNVHVFYFPDFESTWRQ